MADHLDFVMYVIFKLWWWLLIASVTCQNTPGPPEFYSYEVVAEYPHDPRAFTQGFSFDRLCSSSGGGECKDVIWESTGQHGQSSVRLVELESGRVLKQTDLEYRWFGEGMVLLDGVLYQILWQTNHGFKYDPKTLAEIGTFKTPLSDGWGLTTDGKQLIASDGSSTLTWIDPKTMSRVRSVVVRDKGKTVGYLNELEYINGEIWANVWQTECIARIDATSGQVVGWAFLHGLRSALAQRNLAGQRHHMDVLNGIAWDSVGQRFFVTGKLWPLVYEVILVPSTDTREELERKKGSCYMMS